MSMSIATATISIKDNKECISINENGSLIITDYLNELISDNFVEKIFYEEYKGKYDEISYKVVENNHIEKIFNNLFSAESELFKEYFKSKALIDKDEIAQKLENISDIKNLLIRYFISKEKDTVIIIY
ncbi:hypothetical protein EPJ64_11090 [Brachyspira aalborgi]|jgi:hypothetical protein|uniref:Uncharacterized protein n=1 Tax=Brachyspira aalborgi TaxID=29522 RepID=A0AB38PXK5_9SPIR|nr:hypothetical protein [Brachyspira aalborgi]MBS4762691.1 hypothetical protein [Brachyspira sp.]CCY76723.1 unknown [Brachyspira sp. CAG:700]TXJ14928.1 hypothetical protein EPJ77_07130 [Brachyspira aalborgi]TXJ18436.1 hypothetical protein EPJ64_11090 [Brachyspira aalborgi]TXJ24390.1 hypothetical protein EPJ73_11180 [Brachyspira aalborgi]